MLWLLGLLWPLLGIHPDGTLSFGKDPDGVALSSCGLGDLSVFISFEQERHLECGNRSRW